MKEYGLKKMMILLSLVSLVSCGNNKGQSQKPSVESPVLDLNNGPIGVDFSDIESGLACAAGGISIFTFRDGNSNGILDTDESVIKVKSLCHGVNGTNGTNGSNASITLESIAASTTCPQGGVKLTSTGATPIEICNGANGLNGEQGIQGVQGIPGIQGAQGAPGADGTVVTPVKFCANDNSTYPEYGLLIDDELYAVYWGRTPGSPNAPQAFLTKLVAGNYQSTGGNNCLFQVH
jgi:hypothetical protein